MAIDVVRFIIQDAPPPRLDKALARDVPADAALSRSRLSRLLADGAVEINGCVVRDAKMRVEAGAEVSVTIEIVAADRIVAEDIPLEVAYEDEALIVVNKPAGMVVHPAPGSPSGTLVNALMAHCGDDLSGIGGEKRPGIVHRIDKDTSGLLVVAKNDAAHHGLAAQFADHSAERAYLALAHGLPDAGDPRLRGLRGVGFEGGVLRVTTHLARHRTDRQKQAVLFEGGRHAVTRAEILEPVAGGAASLLRCRLETGRTHQIRVHLAYCGHGLIGDPVYGGQRRLPGRNQTWSDAARAFPRQALHAAVLGFEHPISGERMRFEVDMPADMRQLLSILQQESA